MLFQASITITTGKTKAEPQVETMKIAHGIITKFMVRPRPGHGATAELVILHHEHQIAPSTEGMSLHGDAHPIDWEEYYESYQPPYELKLKGWANGSTYSHTFDVFVAVLPRKAILALAVVDAIKGIFGLLSPRRIFTGKG
ncbi:MAG: hypothetical protein KAT75_00640 [Dehalococcoidia bacterium]|nr:hypothetical protein [Dehalococcoidia bacterium]